MDFLNFVQKGVEKSNKSLAAIAEVDEVFAKVNADLKRYTAGELKLDRRVSTIAQIASFTDGIAGIESDYFRHDRIFLSIKTSDGTFVQEVAGWKQRATGYPCILKFDGQELSCGSATHLLNGMTEFLASVGFGNAVNKLTKQASEAGERKKQSQKKAGDSTHLTLVNKPVARSAARVVAKPAVNTMAKAAAKPGAKAAAKPAAKAEVKPGAKAAAKPAAKAAAKPGAKAAAKPAAKAAAKPGAKAAAKPAAKAAVKPGAKAAAKPAAKATAKPSAKAAAKPAIPKPAVKPSTAKVYAKPASAKVTTAEAFDGKVGRESQQIETNDASS